MSKEAVKNLTPEFNQEAVEQSVHQLGLLNGISELEVVTTPGKGWLCALLKTGHIRISIDPEQTVGGYQKGEELSPVSPEITSIFIASHELGHAKDFLDPNYVTPLDQNKSDNFFTCLINDTVIDKRNRRIPLIDSYADAIYSYQLPSDLTELPKHIQLMDAIRISTVVNNPNLTMDDDVKEILGGLTEFEQGGQKFNIMDGLTDPRTSQADRLAIANQYIKPHYDALLQEDLQEQQELQDKIQSSGNGEGEDDDDQTGEGNTDFEEIYKEQQEAIGGYRKEGNEKEQESENEQSGERGSENLAEKIADAIKETQENKQAEKDTKPDNNERPESEQRASQLAEMAHGIKKEMDLSPADANLYVRSLDRWSSVIQDVANVFIKLAAPTEIAQSPRYSRIANHRGVRIHPREMAKVALQIQTRQDQAIWQPVVRVAKRKDVDFGGLDVYLAVDISDSMSEPRGRPKAQCAADTELCLIEGLQLARVKVARTNGKYRLPDVRTQIDVFGSDSETISPISYEPTPKQKGKCYTSTLDAHSSSTNINKTLVGIKEVIDANPGRDAIVIIISDGNFNDHKYAVKTAAQFPHNAVVGQLVIGTESEKFLNDNHETVSNPDELPIKLLGILDNYIRKNQS